MPISIFHVLTATTPDNTNFEIRPIAHWNASHLGTFSATAGSELIGAFSNTNGVSFGLSGGLITVSAIGAQPLISAGTTSNNLSQVVFSNSNGFSFGLSGSTITGSYSNPNFSAGTTSSNLASVVFSNANGVSFGLSGSTITASVPGGGGSTLTFIAKGNTTGQSSSSTVPFSAISFDGAGAISVGMSGGSLVVSAPNTVALTQLSAGMSTAGNTAGTASLATAQLVLVGTGNISLSQSYNLGSATLTFQVPAVSSLVGASGLTVSSAGSTLSIGEILQSRWDAWPLGQSTSQQQTNLSASFRYIQLARPVTFTRVDVPCLVSMSNAATTATADMNVSSGLVVYSRSGSTLSPITGAFGTTTYTWASNSSNYSNLTGGKNFSFPINGSLTAGEYWVGFQISTTNNSSIGLSTTLLGNTISMILGASLTASQIDDFGNTFSANVNAISQGMYTATITATNQTIAMSNISATGTAGMAGNFPVIFRNY